MASLIESHSTRTQTRFMTRSNRGRTQGSLTGLLHTSHVLTIPRYIPPERRWFVAPAIPPLARDTCWKLSPGRGRIISRLSPPYRLRASWRPTGVRPLNVAPLPQAWSPPVRRLAPGCCRCPRRSRALLGEAPVTPGLLACICPAGVGALSSLDAKRVRALLERCRPVGFGCATTS